MTHEEIHDIKRHCAARLGRAYHGHNASECKALDGILQHGWDTGGLENQVGALLVSGAVLDAGHHIVGREAVGVDSMSGSSLLGQIQPSIDEVYSNDSVDTVSGKFACTNGRNAYSACAKHDKTVFPGVTSTMRIRAHRNAELRDMRQVRVVFAVRQGRNQLVQHGAKPGLDAAFARE